MARVGAGWCGAAGGVASERRRGLALVGVARVGTGRRCEREAARGDVASEAARIGVARVGVGPRCEREAARVARQRAGGVDAPRSALTVALRTDTLIYMNV